MQIYEFLSYYYITSTNLILFVKKKHTIFWRLKGFVVNLQAFLKIYLLHTWVSPVRHAPYNPPGLDRSKGVRL